MIKAIHGCGVKFPEIAHSVVLLLMDFLGSDGASGVINFVRYAVVVGVAACSPSSSVATSLVWLPDFLGCRPLTTSGIGPVLRAVVQL